MYIPSQIEKWPSFVRETLAKTCFLSFAAISKNRIKTQSHVAGTIYGYLAKHYTAIWPGATLYKLLYFIIL